jgi:5-methylcytosine-specific restriction protein B
MPRWHRSPDVLAHAQRWRVRCLDADSSVFHGPVSLVSGQSGGTARGSTNQISQLDAGRSFFPRLQQQLAAAPPALTQLAAEVLWILFLSLSESAIAGNSKRRLIRDVWELSGEPLPLTSPALGAVLDFGIANPNPGFNINAWREFVFCVQSILQWKKLPLARRARLLSDPWAFADWLDGQLEADRRQFRHMLLYLLSPRTSNV